MANIEAGRRRAESSAHPDDTKAYFQERGSVLFLSYCRFWEKHPFVQQSLAKKLISWDVPVTWLDGSGWRKYEPTYYWNSSKLSVRQLPELPARRFPWVKGVNARMQGLWIRRFALGAGHPLIWVQAGLGEGLEKQLPYIDVYSVFDDPYRHDPSGVLCRRASLIVCQNDFAYRRFHERHPEKTLKLLPPVEKETDVGQSNEFPMLDRKNSMGYVGSFFSHDFDLALFEKFVHRFPDWNFILAGRTDERGMQTVRRLSAHKNFWYRPWVSPERARKIWKRINVGLLLYKDNPMQHGAFPIKVLEASTAGVPCVGTDVPKNRDLMGLYCLSNDPEKLFQFALRASSAPPRPEAAEQLASRMSPEEHLREIARRLRSSTRGDSDASVQRAS